MQKRILITCALTIFYRINNAHHFPGISYIYPFPLVNINTFWKIMVSFCVFCLANFPLSTVSEYNAFERDNMIFLKFVHLNRCEVGLRRITCL